MHEQSQSRPGEQAGDVVDRYTLIQAVGEGGMGSVWLAEQSEPVARRVALKVIKLGMDTREVVVRFEAERQALALMDHPHIAKVLDGGATASGRPYFVMELVDGEPITEFCDRLQLGLRARLELFMQVCDAIQHAHQKGVIHRDIKPSNILVGERDGVFVPKVIDFGIAKATSAELTQKTMVTQHDQLIGTPEYMSPEQAGMTVEDIDTRADVYSLGALLYELLTGSKPFDVGQILQKGYMELLRMIREVNPERPSTRVTARADSPTSPTAVANATTTKLSMRLRGDLDWIVMKSLEKDRGRRYATANEFASDLGRYLNDEAVAAVPPSAIYRLSKFVRRRKKSVAAVAAIGFLLVAGSVGTAIGWFEAATANASLSEALAEVRKVAAFQSAQLGGIDVKVMGARMRSSLLEAAPEARRAEVEESVAGINFTSLAMTVLEQNIFENALAAIDREFAQQPVVQGRLLATTGSTLDDLGLSVRAKEPHARAVAILRERLGDEHEDTQAAIVDHAYLLQNLDEFDEAESLHRLVWELRQRLLGPNHPRTLASYHAVGAILMVRGDLDEAEPFLRGALQRKRELLGDDDESTVRARNAVSQLEKRRGNYAEAEAHARCVYGAYEASYGKDDRRTHTARKLVGELLWRQRKYAEAEPHFRAAYRGARNALGDDHPDTLAALNDLGNLMIDLERNEEAEQLMQEVVARKRRVLGARHTSTMISLNNLALLLENLKRPTDGLPLLREAREICLAVVGEHHEYTINASGNLARLQFQVGEKEAAVELMVVNQRAALKVFGESHPRMAVTNFNLAATLRDLGRFEEAARLFGDCVTQQRQADPAQRFLLGKAIGGLAICQVELGQHAEAEQGVRQALELEKDAETAAIYVPIFQCVLGSALAGQGRFGDAEQVFRSACEKLVAMSGTNPNDAVGQAVQRCISFYRRWHQREPAAGYDRQAEEWLQRLAKRPIGDK